jgi:hypothetical protein
MSENGHTTPARPFAADPPAARPVPTPPGLTLVDAERVLAELRRTHPDAVEAATWKVAFVDLVEQRRVEQDLMRQTYGQTAEGSGAAAESPGGS